jgi:mono/diheme cytochrome c family protein
VNVKKLLKWIGGIVAVLIVLGLGLVVAANVLYERKRDRVVAVDVNGVKVVPDEATLARGKYLFASRGCGDCHASNGIGTVFINTPDGSLMARAPNITPGGVTAKYSEVDWVRAIRHGVKPDGRAIFIMPSEDYNRFTDADVAAVIAYARTLPPVPGGAAEFTVPLPVKAVYAFGVMKDAAEKIDHKLPPAQPVPEGISAEHGQYVANMCKGCHGAALTGGPIPGAPPDWPPASDLTAATGRMKAYDSADKLKAMFRSGKRSDGSVVAVMPFASLRELNDTDVGALYLYLKSLAKPPTASR